MMSHGPDFSDTDSDLIDDGDYFDFKERKKQLNDTLRSAGINVVTEKETLEQMKLSFYSYLFNGNKQNIITFLDNGIDVDINLQDDWTPLLLAVSFGNYDITQELLKRGAKINTVRNGMTVLMTACNCPSQTSSFEESYKIVKILVENGANVNSINRKRMTALMFAANNGNLPIVKYLFPLSNKEAVDNQKWNALFWAVYGGAADVVEYLLEEGVDYQITDVRGNNPVDLAKNNDHKEIINLFPTDDVDVLSTLLNSCPTEYEEIILLKPGDRPQFFLDICGILNGVQCESVASTISEKHINLLQFLSSTYQDLQNWGIRLPYQRERIIGGIHKFHRYPYHPNSVHIVALKTTFSNVDTVIQLISLIKQITSMEASLLYISKQYDFSKLEEDHHVILKTLQNIRNKIRLCKSTNRNLIKRVNDWDYQTKPADLISKDSVRYQPPWRKILLFSILSTITVVISFRKY